MSLSSQHQPFTRARRAVGGLLALGVAVAGAATLPAAPAFAADPVAGALTSGDSLFPNQGNGGYDALALRHQPRRSTSLCRRPHNAACRPTTVPHGHRPSIRAHDHRRAPVVVRLRLPGLDGQPRREHAQRRLGDRRRRAGATFSRIENTTTEQRHHRRAQARRHAGDPGRAASSPPS